MLTTKRLPVHHVGPDDRTNSYTPRLRSKELDMLNRYAMLWFGLCTIHGLFVLITPANGQSAIHKDDMLEIRGVQFRLGMDQNLAFKRLREERVGVLKIEQFSSSNKTAWRLCETLEDTECNLGQVTFMNGRLELVLKRWIETKTAARVVTAFYGAAKDFEKHGFNPSTSVDWRLKKISFRIRKYRP